MANAHATAENAHHIQALAPEGRPKAAFSVTTTAVAAAMSAKAQDHHHNSSVRWATITIKRARVKDMTPPSRTQAYSGY
jgi:hypothetical protein